MFITLWVLQVIQGETVSFWKTLFFGGFLRFLELFRVKRYPFDRVKRYPNL
jgi:hypothetical protein